MGLQDTIVVYRFHDPLPNIRRIWELELTMTRFYRL